MNNNNVINIANKPKSGLDEKIAIFQNKNDNNQKPKKEEKMKELISNKELNNNLNINKEKNNQNIKDKINIFDTNKNEETKNLLIQKENSQKDINKDKLKEKKFEKNISQNNEIKMTNTVKSISKFKIDNSNENANKSNKEGETLYVNQKSGFSGKIMKERINIFNSNINKIKEKEQSNNINKNNVNILKTNKEDDCKKEIGKNNFGMNNISQKDCFIKKKDKEEKKENKPNEKKCHIDQAILEKLQLFYKPTKKKEGENDTTKLSNKEKIISNDNNLLKKEKEEKEENQEKEGSKIDDSNLDEKEMPTEKLASIKMTMHINDIKNKNRNDGIISTNIPKKLNLKEIFKKLNIEQISSNIQAEKRDEIMKFAQRKKEEEENIDKINEVEQEIEQDQEIEQKPEVVGEDIEKDYGCEEIIEENRTKDIANEIIKEEPLTEIKNKEENIYNKINDEIYNESNKEEVKVKPKRRMTTLNKFIKNIFHINKNKNKSQKEDTEQNEKTSIKRKLFVWNGDEEEEESSLNENRYSSINSQRNNSFMEDNIIESFNENKTLMSNDLTSRLENTEKKNMRNTLQTSKSSIQFLTDKKRKIIKNNEIFLDMKNISEEDEKFIKDDTFCESFFLASFPTENGKIVEGSEKDLADCNHEDCSKLPAMLPEIIYKYPQDDKKGLEINNLAASICFPNGIKICYEENKEKIKTVRNYRSSFTNQIGDRLFAVTYHFFLEMQNNDFADTYKNFPIRYQLSTYQDELCATFNDELEEDIAKKLELYSQLIFRDNVYIPFCLCLISKYPFYEQMEKCLESIMMTINYYDTTPDELNKLINYIVRSIPLPPINSKVSFALPHLNKICEIQWPFFEDILQFGDDPVVILKHLSINNIIIFFKLLILEQKILVIGKDNDIISQIILNFVSLLYPSDWIHTNIPIMSEKMLKFLQAFLPFLNGMNINLFEKAKRILGKAENVFIINIDEDTIKLNNYLRRNAKEVKISNYINKKFGSLPKNIENLLFKELKSIKNDYEKTQNHNYNKSDINIRIKNIFMHVFVEIYCDYEKYSHIIDNYPVFNSYLFVNGKPEADRTFYKELTSTQIFQMFIQNSFSDDKKFYFDERYNEYRSLKEKGENKSNIFSKSFENFKKKYLSFREINNNYIIKPIILKNFEKIEEKHESKNMLIKLRDINSFVSKEFESYNQYLNNKGVLKENQRIIGRPIKLSHENDPKNYTIFTIPQTLTTLSSISETSSQKKENETNSEISIDNSSSMKKHSIRLKIISGDGKNEQKIRFSIYVRIKKWELTEDQMDEIKDNIRGIMTRLYKSEIKNIEEDKKTIMNCINTQFGRNYFISVITSGNKKDHAVKTLQLDSFEFFKYIIFNTLLNILGLEENDENIICAVKLTKICLYIKTYKNKKERLLSDEIYSSLDNFSIFKEQIFWKFWIEDGLTENDLKTLKKIRKNGNAYTSIEEDENYKIYIEHSFDIIDKLFSTMMKMKISNSFIYSTITGLGQEYIFDNTKFSLLMQNLINEIQYFKKLSNK